MQPIISALSTLLLVIASLSCSSSSFATAYDVNSHIRVAPTFVLDLAAPPQKRWDGAVNLILAKHPWEDSFGPVFTDVNSSVFRHVAAYSADAPSQLCHVLRQRFPEHLGELEGLASQFSAAGHSEVSLEFLCVYAWYHELAHAKEETQLQQRIVNKQNQQQQQQERHRDCTGILVLPEDPTAPILHGRNLDQGVPQGRNLTLSIHVVRGGNKDVVLYTGHDFYWPTSGWVTATQQASSPNGGLTLEENWRFSTDAPGDVAPPLSFILQRILSLKPVPQALMFRVLLQQQQQQQQQTTTTEDLFDNAVSFFNNTQFAAPFYLIMSGTGRRGVIVSIASWLANETNQFAFLKSGSSSSSSWFEVQTNYDRWLPDPPNDNRRTVAINTLHNLGQPPSLLDATVTVWQTLSTYPVHNTETFYSLVMNPEARTPPRAFIRVAMRPLDKCE